MGKSWISALLAALWACLSLVPALPVRADGEAPAAECRCLAVGMDAFVTEENTFPCSANNAEMMGALFAECLPEGTRVTRRVNGPGSRAGMEELIRDTFRDAGEEDTSYLYLSTHGVTWEEDGALKTALILSDGEREEALEPRTLREWMDRIPGKKVLILDCCHAGAAAEAFRGEDWRVLAGCRAEEDCYFWAAEEETGMGYFTSALENALRASAGNQIDPDGNGAVSLTELAGRVRSIYGVSKPVFLPEEDGEMLFILPEERAEDRILDLQFDPVTEDEDHLTLQFRFRTEAAVKIEYRLVPMGENGWDFGRAVRLPDREREGQKRGVMSPGEKNRSIRVSRERLGAGGKALLQIVSFRGVYGQVPVPEATFEVVSGRENH